MLPALKAVSPDPIPPTRSLRDAFGAFATGVTIVTTRSPSGTVCGVTANSFSSLSLDPPLVLWSLGANASSFPVFEAAAHFVVHVLADDQDVLARRFATSGIDRFSGLALEDGPHGIPLIPDVAARFDCRTLYRNWGGDHVIYVGQVDHHVHSPERRPLLFHAGKMGRLGG